ncbi:MAG: carboxypeptidase-like regulatory domain-containing protein, partial [Blastocatellia bacterium]
MHSKAISHIFLVSVCLLLSVASTAKGQTSTATLKGTVTDPKGSIITGATVKAQSDDTGLVRTAVSEESGLYVFNFLPVGKYVVTI